MRIVAAVRTSDAFMMTARADVSSRKRSALDRNIFLLRGVVKLRDAEASEGVLTSCCQPSTTLSGTVSRGTDVRLARFVRSRAPSASPSRSTRSCRTLCRNGNLKGVLGEVDMSLSSSGGSAIVSQSRRQWTESKPGCASIPRPAERS